VGNSVAPTEAGIRTLRISPDGKLMASGDRGGNLRYKKFFSLKSKIILLFLLLSNTI
jgi:hypothetical protein